MPLHAHLHSPSSNFPQNKYNLLQMKCQKNEKMKAAIDKEVLFYYDMFVKDMAARRISSEPPGIIIQEEWRITSRENKKGGL